MPASCAINGIGDVQTERIRRLKSKVSIIGMCPSSYYINVMLFKPIESYSQTFFTKRLYSKIFGDF